MVLGLWLGWNTQRASVPGVRQRSQAQTTNNTRDYEGIDMDIKEIAFNIRNQDNRITANPIFMVQVRVEICGLENGYEDHIKVIDEDHDEIDPPDGMDSYSSLADWHEQQEELGHTLVGCRYEWHNKQPFFTEVGAQRYIDRNRHNLGKTRIYVESGYRNDEWEAIRETLRKIE